jgi:hypothetical protein
MGGRGYIIGSLGPPGRGSEEVHIRLHRCLYSSSPRFGHALSEAADTRIVAQLCERTTIIKATASDKHIRQAPTHLNIRELSQVTYTIDGHLRLCERKLIERMGGYFFASACGLGDPSLRQDYRRSPWDKAASLVDSFPPSVPPYFSPSVSPSVPPSVPWSVLHSVSPAVSVVPSSVQASLPLVRCPGNETMTTAAFLTFGVVRHRTRRP